MPGQKTVNWTEANRAKVLDAMLALERIKVAPETSEQIAAYVGDGCTAKAVNTLLGTIGPRKRSTVLATVSGTGAGLSASKANNSAPLGKSKADPLSRVIKGKVTKPRPSAAKTKNEDSILKGFQAEVDAGGLPETPPMSGEEFDNPVIKREPATPGSLRVSPRKNKSTVDYKTLSGRESDEETVITSEGVSEPTDGEFDATKEGVAIGDHEEEAVF